MKLYLNDNKLKYENVNFDIDCALTKICDEFNMFKRRHDMLQMPRIKRLPFVLIHMKKGGYRYSRGGNITGIKDLTLPKIKDDQR